MRRKMAGMTTPDLLRLQGKLVERLDALVDESILVTVNEKMEVRTFTNGAKRHVHA